MVGSLFGSRIATTALQTSTEGGAALLMIFLAFFGVVYSTYILVCEIADRDVVWLLLSLFVPFAALIPFMDIAKAFGKGTGYGIGPLFLGSIFFPLLGFGDARYRGAISI